MDIDTQTLELAAQDDRSPLTAALAKEVLDSRKKIRQLESTINHYVASEHARKSFDQTEDIIKRADEAERDLMEFKAAFKLPFDFPSGMNVNTASSILNFASALALKLYKSESKYNRSDDWIQTDWEPDCHRAFLRHIEKGDPIDVAAYCMFKWHHGWSTAPTMSDLSSDYFLDPISTEALNKGAQIVTGAVIGRGAVEGGLALTCKKSLYPYS